MSSTSEASRIALLACLVGIGLVVGAFLLPWFEVDASSGRRTPPDGLQSPDDRGITYRTWDNGAFLAAGDAPPADPAANRQWSDLIGALTMGAGILLGIGVLAEIPGIRLFLPRAVSLSAIGLGFAAMVAAGIIGWFLIPQSYGLSDAPFATSLDGDAVYWRTSLQTGWWLGALAVPIAAIAWFAKFQAGWADPSAVEHLGRRTGVGP